MALRWGPVRHDCGGSLDQTDTQAWRLIGVNQLGVTLSTVCWNVMPRFNNQWKEIPLGSQGKCKRKPFLGGQSFPLRLKYSLFRVSATPPFLGPAEHQHLGISHKQGCCFISWERGEKSMTSEFQRSALRVWHTRGWTLRK